MNVNHHPRLRGEDKTIYMKLVGSSKNIRNALEKALSLSKNNEPCLIIGESGTGKTHLARFIHISSPREAENFTIFSASDSKDIVRDLCGVMKVSLLGNENLTPGIIDAVGSGTLLIKDLQNIPLMLQPQLLATITLGGYKPIDAGESMKALCRFIFSAPQELDRFVQEKRILPELAQLLKRNTMVLSKLRDRNDDVGELANHFLKKWCDNLGYPQKKFSKQALKLLKKSSWSGNVRELQLIILNSVLHFSTPQIEAEHLQLKMAGNWHPHTEEQLEDIALEELVEKKIAQFMHRLGKFDVENLHAAILERVERPLIKLVMERSNNNQLKAARTLGINRNTLRAKLQKLELK